MSEQCTTLVTLFRGLKKSFKGLSRDLDRGQTLRHLIGLLGKN
jgi:hypothetical protein